MRKIDLSPEAYNDLEGIKERLNTEFGEATENKILKSIVKDMKRLEKYPETDIKLYLNKIKMDIAFIVAYMKDVDAQELRLL